ncbi:type VI secretion system amidase effector protein Tae4 [Hellea sp.]|nr:type VI secretion system amidase effector protein Tae4 [Hellea sp.]
MLNIDFVKLKDNYSTDSTSVHRCSINFPNTCAIRMSEAIVKAEPKYLDIFKAATINKCPHGYIRGAQDLAKVLSSRSALGPRSFGWGAQPSGKRPANATGKKGIVCFMNIPGFSGQGHIDLWNDTVPVGSDYWDSETIWMWKL